MSLNDTICVNESEPSDIKILNLTIWEGSFITLGLGLVATVGFVIRGLFIYFLTYEAQKDRTINTRIYEEQVIQSYCKCYPRSKSHFTLSDNPNVNNVDCFNHGHSLNCLPNTNAMSFGWQMQYTHGNC